MRGKLYLVATPIGNLDDITMRALKKLAEVDLIACEDTRRTIKLLNYYNINTPLVSYHKFNEKTQSKTLIDRIESGENIAIVSDAGTPIISDPGLVIVRKAIESKIDVVAIPGATALISSLIVSGLESSEFSFFGFLPDKTKVRKEKLEYIKKLTQTLIFYVSPHDYSKDIKDLCDYLGHNRKVSIAREITKMHEEVIRGSLGEKEILEYQPRGEICVVVEGADTFIEEINNPLCDVSISEHLDFYIGQGMKRNNAMREVAQDRDISKNNVYELILKEKKG
ncbi:MAG: 16S rRNA (cytidine(1402)-2'-O)-methyltransferase [Clostridia bacterium]